MLESALYPTIRQDLKAQLHGELICPNDRGYDASRKVWNGMIDIYPALIVRCADVVDVVHAVQFAREHHLLAAVRGGGHSVSGSSVCNGGIVIDLSRMKGIWVDPEQMIAWAQAGLTLGEFVQATQAYGLATTTGTVGGTGLLRLKASRAGSSSLLSTRTKPPVRMAHAGRGYLLTFAVCRRRTATAAT